MSFPSVEAERDHWKDLAEERGTELESLQAEWRELTESSAELEKTLEAELEAEAERSAELQAEVDRLRQAASGQNASAELGQQVDALQIQVTKLQEEKEAWTRAKTELEEQVEQANEKARIASASLDDLTHQVERAKEDLVIARSENEQFKAEAEHEKQELRSRIRDLEDEQATGRSTAVEDGGDNDRVQNLEQQLQEARDANKELQETVKELSSRAEAATSSQTKVNKELSDRTEEVARLKTSLSEVQAELRDALESAAGATAAAAADSPTQPSQDDQTAALRREVEALQNKLTASSASFSAVQNDLEYAQEELETAKYQLTAAKEEAETVRTELKDQQKKHDEELAALKTRLTSARSDLAEAKKAATEAAAASSSKPMDPAPPADDSAQQELESLRIKVSELQGALDAAREEAEAAVAEKEEEIEELVAAISELKLQQKSPRKRDPAAAQSSGDAAVSADLASAQSRLQTLSDHADELEEQLRDAAEALQAERQDKKLLQDRFSEAEEASMEAADHVKELERQVHQLIEHVQTSVAASESMKRRIAELEATRRSSPALSDRSGAAAGAGGGASHSPAWDGLSEPHVQSLDFNVDGDGESGIDVDIMGEEESKTGAGESKTSSPSKTPYSSALRKAPPRAAARGKDFKTSRAHVERAMHSLMTKLRSTTQDVEAIHSRLQAVVADVAAADDADASLRDTIDEDVTSLGSTAAGLLGLLEELQSLMMKRDATLMEENGRLLARVHATRGNILVYARVRPPTADELRAGNVFEVVDVLSDTDLAFYDAQRRAWRPFAMDRVIGPDVDQEGLFREVEHIAVSVVDGYRACIFAYGITGSGKTYTMQGPDESPGVNIRILTKVFELCKTRSATHEFSITLSMLEIYNEELRDLLVSDLGASERLEIRTTGTQAGVSVQIPHLTRLEVRSVEEVMRAYQRGVGNRAVAATNVHEHSSRSHCVLTVEVSGKGRSSAYGNIMGKLNLVDLAGSERVKKSLAVGDRMTEARSINKSLSALGDVLEALDVKKSHVPYRNSKLTHLLQDSLSANSRTLMICAVSPTSLTSEETLYSLQFAQRTRNIELGPARKMIYYRNVDETMTKLRHDLNVAHSQREALQLAVKEAQEAKKKIESRVKHTVSDSRKHYEAREKVLQEANRELKDSVDKLTRELHAEKRARTREAEELTTLKEKLRTQSHSRSVHAREAKAMEARALKLSAEVERVKEMLLEARSTVSYMRKTQNYLTTRGPRDEGSPPTNGLDVVSPHTPGSAGGVRSARGPTSRRSADSSQGRRVPTSSNERRIASSGSKLTRRLPVSRPGTNRARTNLGPKVNAAAGGGDGVLSVSVGADRSSTQALSRPASGGSLIPRPASTPSNGMIGVSPRGATLRSNRKPAPRGLKSVPSERSTLSVDDVGVADTAIDGDADTGIETPGLAAGEATTPMSTNSRASARPATTLTPGTPGSKSGAGLSPSPGSSVRRTSRTSLRGRAGGVYRRVGSGGASTPGRTSKQTPQRNAWR